MCKLIKKIKRIWKEGYRSNICEISFRFGIGLKYCRFEEHDSIMIHFIFPLVFIKLPWGGDLKDCMLDYWGFKYYDGGIHFSWGGKTKILWMPWDLVMVRHTIWDRNGSVVPTKDAHAVYGEKRKKLLKCISFPFQYTLKSGEVQHREAVFYVEEREWRWRGLQFLPFPRTIRKVINVTFSDEIGERTGSYKGGVIGTTFEMKKGEPSLVALYRMEREYKC